MPILDTFQGPITNHRTGESFSVQDMPSSLKYRMTYLNPTIGHCLHMLHLAWCLAVSAAANRCMTGSHTSD